MPPDKRPLLIGITGSIGSGKSTFCRYLEQRYTVHYADILSHKAMESAWISGSLAIRWGNAIVRDGVVNRKLVSEIVFSDPDELAWLNKLLHPIVLGKMQELVDNSKQSIVIFEVPLLFEAKLEKCFDYVVLITAEEPLRISRLNADRGIPPEASQARMRHQLPDDVKIAAADKVIYNDSSIQKLEKAAADFINSLPGIPRRETIPFNQIIDES